MSLINVIERNRPPQVTDLLDCYENETDFIKQFGWLPGDKVDTWACYVG